MKTYNIKHLNIKSLTKYYFLNNHWNYDWNGYYLIHQNLLSKVIYDYVKTTKSIDKSIMWQYGLNTPSVTISVFVIVITSLIFGLVFALI